MAKKITVGFISLGCSKNLCDTEVMLHHLMDAGYEITPEETEADVVIINTCAFIESAKKETIENILDIAWLKENKKSRATIAEAAGISAATVGVAVKGEPIREDKAEAIAKAMGKKVAEVFKVERNILAGIFHLCKYTC